MAKKQNTLASLRSIGKSFNCVMDCSKSVKTISKHGSTDSSIINVKHIDVDEADKIAEKITDDEEFECAYFLAPLNGKKIIDGDDDDGDEYWNKRKPILIERLTKTFGWRYGIDFAILRRGFFSLLVLMFKNEDGEWYVPKNFLDAVIPDSSFVFMRTLDYYYRNTDSEFFPINALTISDKEVQTLNTPQKEVKGVSIESLQVDISFLRSDSFKGYDSEEGRIHFTKMVFTEGILHSLALEHRVITFDDEDIDEVISNTSDIVCYR